MTTMYDTTGEGERMNAQYNIIEQYRCSADEVFEANPGEEGWQKVFDIAPRLVLKLGDIDFCQANASQVDAPCREDAPQSGAEVAA